MSAFCSAAQFQQGTAADTATTLLFSSARDMVVCTNSNQVSSSNPFTSSSRPIVYQSPRIPPRQSPPDYLPSLKPFYLPIHTVDTENTSKEQQIPGSPSDSSSTNTVCSLSESQHQQQQSKPMSQPLPSPRSPSKIPTPLPRKNLSNSSTPASSPIKSPQSPKQKSPMLTKVSEIPVPIILTPPTSPTMTTVRQEVVEVCEKVVVEPGQIQCVVTPFITVERIQDKTDGFIEVRVDEQLSTAYKKF